MYALKSVHEFGDPNLISQALYPPLWFASLPLSAAGNFCLENQQEKYMQVIVKKLGRNI